MSLGCSHIDWHLFAKSILTVVGGIDRNISNVDSGLGIRSILTAWDWCFLLTVQASTASYCFIDAGSHLFKHRSFHTRKKRWRFSNLRKYCCGYQWYWPGYRINTQFCGKKFNNALHLFTHHGRFKGSARLFSKQIFMLAVESASNPW